MLGSERLAFETPNVIDPGDLPPTAPNRLKGSHSTASSSSESSSDDAAAVVPQQSRLLRDIGDLQLKPEVNYDAYEDEEFHNDDDDDDDPRHYAASLLTANGSPATKAALGPTVQLQPSSRHLVRQLVLRVGFRMCALVGGICILLVAVIVLAQNRKGNEQQQIVLPPRTTQRNDDMFHYLINWVASNGITDVRTLADADSPQYRALLWLAKEDEALPAITSASAVVDYRLTQRYVLAVLYFGLGGPAWKSQASFLTSQHECSWYQDQVFDAFIGNHYAVGVSCDTTDHRALRVRDLFLPNVGLTGTVPSELAHLTSLRMLAVPDNDLSGTIPSALEHLTDLVFVDFKYNDFTGIIPDWMGGMDLEVLGLSNNMLIGSIPSQLRWSRMHTLALDDNMLTGSLEFANSLTELQFLYADRNQFTGSIGSTFLNQLPKIHTIDVSGNQLTSTEFPMHLVQHPTLHVLDMADNLLAGDLPELSGPNVALEYLSLRSNQFQGPIPNSWKFLSYLEHLDVYNNTLTGQLPVELKELDRLTYLSLGVNFFDSLGPPQFLVDMPELRELNLEGLNLDGPIPDWIGTYLTNLELLDMSHNTLDGTIPETVFAIPNLQYLLLHGNQLTGSLPPTGGYSLSMLTLHHNNMAAGSVDGICQVFSTNSAVLLATDCTVACPCCESCCEEEATEAPDMCFETEMAENLHAAEGQWEFLYQRQPFGFDPNILDEVGLFQSFDESP